MHRRRPHSAPDSRALPLAREPEINSVAPTHSSCLLKWRPQGVQPGQPGGRPEMLPPGRRKHGTRTRLRIHFPAIRRKTASPPQYAAPKDRATCCRAPFIASEGEAARTYQMERPRSNNGPRKAFNFSKPSRNVFTTTSVPYHAESTLSSAQVLKLFVAVRSRHFFRVCLCVSVKWLSDSFTAVILPCVRPGSVF